MKNEKKKKYGFGTKLIAIILCALMVLSIAYLSVSFIISTVRQKREQKAAETNVSAVELLAEEIA